MPALSASVDICNLALGHIGATQILALNESREEAIRCRTFLPQAVASTLQALDWGFARRYMEAVTSTDYVIPQGYEFAYTYPPEASAVRGLARWIEDEPFEHFQVGHQTSGDTTHKLIYTNHSGPFIVYTVRDMDEGFAPPLFIDLVARRLAFLIAFPITKDEKVQARQYQLLKEEGATVAAAELNEGVRRPPISLDPDWIEAR